MKNIIKLITGVFGLALMNISAFAKEGDIYGWDINCTGDNGVSVRALQSDDSFKVSYESNDIDLDQGYSSGNSEFDSSNKILLFSFNGKSGINYSGALTVIRDKAVGDGTGIGVLHLENKNYDPLRYDLHCFVRSAPTEDAYRKLINTPFPQF